MKNEKIIVSNEAHFWINGYVNKQNFIIWNDANPYEVHQVALHPQKATASLVRTFSKTTFDDDPFVLTRIEQYGRGRHVVLAGRRYVPHSERHDILHERFEGMVISRGWDVN